MTTLLARNAEVLVTMDGERRELRNASLFARDGVIQQIGDAADLPQDADVVLDLAGQIVLPGLINCHHHLDQVLTRNLPAGQNTNLFPWLRAHYRIWGSRTPEDSRTATIIGCAELALTGCTPSLTTPTSSRMAAVSMTRLPRQRRSASASSSRGAACHSVSPRVGCRQTTVSRKRPPSLRIACA